MMAEKNDDCRAIHKEELKDIRDVRVNLELPPAERIADYIRQIENPYLFRCGDIVIKVKHQNTGLSIDDCLKGYVGG